MALYNDEGTELEKKLFFAQNGVVSGSIDLGTNVEPGSYYLRAYTNWMNNFPEDESFVALPINVVNPYKEELKQSEDNEITISHDIQEFLPEGGYAITNTTSDWC